MRAQVYRNLDRPFTLFGIRGRYIVIAGVCLLAILLVSLIAGSVSNALHGPIENLYCQYARLHI